MTNVTVVIPALDCAGSLRACLASPGLRRRGERPRIIVADNGSRDGTAAVAAVFGAELYVFGRRGPAAARNGGLEASESEFVAFIDADCVAAEGWLDALCGQIDGSDHVGVGGALRWRTDKTALAQFYQEHYPHNDVLAASGPASYLLTSNAIFRRRELQDAGGFDTRLRWCEDLELGLRLNRGGATFGYAADAVVEIEPPATALDRFAQFYKYGSGLERVCALHPDVIDWCPAREWATVTAAARQTIGGNNRARSSLDFEMRLGYFTGWLDATLRHRLLGNLPLPLPVRYRCTATPPVERRIALSIDDGPSEVTLDFLRVLDEYDATATFFLVGERAARRTAVVDEIVRHGHDVFAHGWNHRRVDCISAPEVRAEFERTENVLRKVRPTPRPYLIRLPYGAGAEDPHVHAALQGWNPHCEIVQWSDTLHDWDPFLPDDDISVYARALDQLITSDNLTGSILLLHDTPIGLDTFRAGPRSLAVFRQTLGTLRRHGYTFTSIGGQS